MEKYLADSLYVDFSHPDVLGTATSLARGAEGELDIARRCFEFVRDQIKHSWDYSMNPVTCKASEVLRHGTGFCYAKSHLLAALLRANNIPTGLCYQRLTIGDKPPFCLHGLNAVYLHQYGWYRIDARGNKQGVCAQFTPPLEQLAFAIRIAGEADLPEIWAEPLPIITEVLNRYDSYADVAENLPDISVLAINS